MKKIYNVFLVLALPAVFLLFTSEVLYHSGSPGGKTGSPGDNGANCTQCHSGTAQIQEAWIYSPELSVMGYSPGQSYNVIVVGDKEDALKYGFEATAEDASGNKVGTFQVFPTGLTQIINNGKAITHTAEGTNPLLPPSTTWFFTWVAPASTVGDITFYVAVNAANGNGANSGDQINLSQFVASPATGIGAKSDPFSIGLYPNPSSGKVHFYADNTLTSNRIEVYALGGQIVYSMIVTPGINTIDLSGLYKGIYIARTGNLSQQLILR
jgi:hypothetical protein